ncbi:MAG: N-acetylmuramoyl-L-alanine amidase, partial [Pseudomonadota bacterium]
MKPFVIWAASLLFCATGAFAQGFTALARLEADASQITRVEDALKVDLALTQGVPYRAYVLAEPARLVLDFQEVDFAGVTSDDLGRKGAVRFGAVRPGWSRMVVMLGSRQVIELASMAIDPASGAARLTVDLALADDATFAARSGAPDDPSWAQQAPLPEMVQAADKTGLTVVLDPGHGGIDPGAQGGGITEAELMLILARELQEALDRAGDFNVVLTREDDSFVSLERRVQIARAAGADIFLSLHADALASGQANGAAVYTLSDEASDAASRALAERHNRADLLAGVDLTGQDDQIARVLMDLARTENKPRSEALARGVILGINTAVGHTYKRPIQSAGFSVLKAADIPSVLVEVGFLSS